MYGYMNLITSQPGKSFSSQILLPASPPSTWGSVLATGAARDIVFIKTFIYLNFIILLIILFYLFEIDRRWSLCCFSLQMAATARTGAG